MVITPTATNTSDKNKSGQSKWEINRRSICTGFSVDFDLLLIGVLFLDFDEFLEHLLRHRRSGIAAVPAMLHQHCNSDLRIFHRSVGNEPGMIAIEIGELLGFDVSTLHFDHLSGAGFARDGHDLGAGSTAGAARRADDVSKRCAHALQCVWLEFDGANELGPIYTHG